MASGRGWCAVVGRVLHPHAETPMIWRSEARDAGAPSRRGDDDPDPGPGPDPVRPFTGGLAGGFMERRFITRSGGIAIAAASALALAFGCASTPEEEPEPSMPTGSEFEQGAMRQEEPPEPAPRTELGLDLATVYFDFDKAEIKEVAKPKLRANAEQIKQSDKLVTIEGHCDERGDEEYNLALGQRRANAVKKYLVNLGVPASRLRTVSYGEARPAVQGHSESAWRWNRRAEFRASSG
jgi:peptidoglycan-associated lipoprotein